MHRENYDRTASERCIDKFLYKAVKDNKASNADDKYGFSLIKKIKLNE